MTLPDLIPLGVSGSVKVPLKTYLASVSDKASPIILINDQQRIEYISGRIDKVIDRPLTLPGSAEFAHQILNRFKEINLLYYFSEKVLETLRDDEVHNRIVISPDHSISITFIVWPGTHREMQSQRFGKYLSSLVTTGKRLVEAGYQIGGLLEFDVYIRENANTQIPNRPLDDVFQIDVEYSYIPGFFFGSQNITPSYLPKTILLNPDLCSPDEMQMLEKIKERSSS